MPVTTLDASNVMREVLNKYEPYLPNGLASNLRSANPARIFRILPANQYQPIFDSYFRSFFAAINVVALGGAERMIGTANRSGPTIACPAFCAPAVNVLDRTIYVNRDAGVTVGTLYHEFIHYLQHGNFYPEFYSVGGRSPIILEGVTEYLTREVSTSVKVDRSSQQKYQSFLNDVTGRMTGSSTVTDAFSLLAFQGDFSLLQTLGGTAPRFR